MAKVSIKSENLTPFGGIYFHVRPVRFEMIVLTH